MAFATVLERSRIELLAEDLHIFGYTLLADVTPSTMYFTTCIGYTYGRLDAVSVSAETTIDGRVLSPGIWYFPEDTGVGLADVNMMVQLPTGTTLTSVEVTAAVGSPPAAVSGQVSKDLLFEHYQWSTRFTVPLNTAETPVLERTHRVTNAAVITSPAVVVAGDHYGLVIEAGDSMTLDGNVTPSPVRTDDTVVVMWYDGTTWRMLGQGTAAKVRVFADETGVAPVVAGSPTIVEITAFAAADSANRWGTLVGYNGTDTDSTTGGYPRLYDVDVAGTVTYITQGVFAQNSTPFPFTPRDGNTVVTDVTTILGEDPLWHATRIAINTAATWGVHTIAAGTQRLALYSATDATEVTIAFLGGANSFARVWNPQTGTLVASPIAVPVDTGSSLTLVSGVQGKLVVDFASTLAGELRIGSYAVDLPSQTYPFVVDVALETVAVPVVPAKNIITFPAGDTTLEFFQDDLSTGVDGRLYVNVPATANLTLPTVVGNSGKRIILSTDWGARLTAAPNWTTQGLEDIQGGEGNLSFSDPNNRLWPESGTSFVHLIADEANNRFLAVTAGDVTLSMVVASFADDADVVAAALPAGSLYQGNSTGDLGDQLFRVKTDLTRVVV